MSKDMIDINNMCIISYHPLIGIYNRHACKVIISLLIKNQGGISENDL